MMTTITMMRSENSHRSETRQRSENSQRGEKVEVVKISPPKSENKQKK